MGSYDNTEWIQDASLTIRKSRKWNEIMIHWEKREGVDIIGRVCKKYLVHSKVNFFFLLHVLIVVSSLPLFSQFMFFLTPDYPHPHAM